MFPEIIIFIVLIVSIVFHEMMHGFAANVLGDPTARLAGRLSLNPIRHIDPLGSIIVPALMYLSAPGIIGKDIVFGWAKPVPYNPYNLTNQKWGEAFVAVAGPLGNLFLAFVFSLIIRFGLPYGLDHQTLTVMAYVVYINIFLGLFNSIPFPPLDGSKVIVPFLPLGLGMKYRNLTIVIERTGVLGLFMCLLVITWLFHEPFFTAVLWIYHIMTGL